MLGAEMPSARCAPARAQSVLTAFDPEDDAGVWAGWTEGGPEDAARVVEMGRLLARHAGGVGSNQQDAGGRTACMLNII